MWFSEKFGSEFELRAFGLRNLGIVLRKMLRFRVEFSICWTWRIVRRKLRLRLMT